MSRQGTPTPLEVNSKTNLTANLKEEPADSDGDRLQMLGYDETLGRPYTFWGLLAMNMCHEGIFDEFLLGTSLYSYDAPLVFIIGYPCQLILHLILLAPMAELASAFPVAGATATWSWRCARDGPLRHERQWGWLMSGLVLAAHVGRNVAGLYGGAIGISSLYVMMRGLPITITGEALHPEEWWNPVWYILLITVAAVLVLSRVARTNTFWIVSISLDMVYWVMALALICYGGWLKRGLSKGISLGFPNKKNWKHSPAFTIFTALPLKMVAIDCPPHMAEETKHPSRTVPRVMYAATIAEFTIVYIMVLAYTFCIVPAFGSLGRVTSPFVPIVYACDLNDGAMYALAICGILLGNLQTVSSTLVTSRFIYALARDCAIPFSNVLVRTTKEKEPLAADLAIILALYASVASWWVSAKNYYQLVIPFLHWFTCVPYTIVLVLFISSRLQLEHVGRTQFTLGRWTRPLACVAALWGILVFIQGSMPSLAWTLLDVDVPEDSYSFLPYVTAGMLAIMAVSWFLYGRRHYIGPIRSWTKWSAGVEINPQDYATSAGRGAAIRAYISANTGSGEHSSSKVSGLLRRFKKNPGGSENHHSHSGDTSGAAGLPRGKAIFAGVAKPESAPPPESSPKRRFRFGPLSTHHETSESFSMTDVSGSKSGGSEAASAALPESQLLYETRAQASQLFPPAQQESQLLHETRPALQSFLPAQQVSQLLRSQHVPLGRHDHTFSHAQQESQLEPTRSLW